MPVLVATPKAADANAFATVSTIAALLRTRLYTTDWDNAASTPSAEDYLVNDPGAALAVDTTSIPVDGGTGTFTASSLIKFAGHATEYTVGTALSGDGNLTISPGLVSVPADGEAVERLSANDHEKSVIWSTRIFDSMMDWNGVRTDANQALGLPRYGLVDRNGDSIDEDTIPAIVEEALAEMVLHVLRKDYFKKPGILGQGIKDVQVAAIRISVDDTAQEEVIPENVRVILEPIGQLRTSARRGARGIPLGRS